MTAIAGYCIIMG